MDEPGVALNGPYSANYGTDAYGHLTNRRGRCEQLNTTGICPTRNQQQAWMLTLPLEVVVQMAREQGIAIPAIPVASILIVAILNITFP